MTKRVQPSDVDDIVGTRDAARILGFAMSTLAKRRLNWRSPADGPPFIRLSTRKVGYRRSALNAWLAERERS